MSGLDKPFMVWIIIYFIGSVAIMFVGQWTEEFGLSMVILVAWLVVISLCVMHGRWRWYLE